MTNPDVVALHAFLADPVPRPMTSSPLLEALGARLLAWEPDRAELTMTFAPGELFRQGAGVIQGGAVTAILDFAMAFAAMARLGDQAAVTSSITTNLMGAGMAPEVAVRGRVLRTGRRLVFAEADLEGGGRLLATATSTLLPVSLD